MNAPDRQLQPPLRGEVPASASEPNIIQEVLGTFRGRRCWMAVYVFVASFLSFLVAIWAGFRFYNAPSIAEQLQGGGLTLLLVLMVCLMKVWFWLEMQTNRVLRELKRLEIRLLNRPPGA